MRKNEEDGVLEKDDEREGMKREEELKKRKENEIRNKKLLFFSYDSTVLEIFTLTLIIWI
jgi:hypothetical protein